MDRLIAGWLLLMALWIFLFKRVEPTVLAVGAPAAVLLLLLYSQIMKEAEPQGTPRSSLRAFCRIDLWLRYLALLAYEVLRSTFQTVYLILSNRIDPGIVVVHTSLKKDSARMGLLHSITLTPSTIAILLEDGLVYVHWLKLRSRGYEEAVKRNFERDLSRIFEPNLPGNKD